MSQAISTVLVAVEESKTVKTNTPKTNGKARSTAEIKMDGATIGDIVSQVMLMSQPLLIKVVTTAVTTATKQLMADMAAKTVERNCELDVLKEVQLHIYNNYYALSMCCISVQLVDHLLAVVELETKFNPHHLVALLGLCLVPSALVTLPDPDGKGQLAKLVDLYEKDLASPESVSHQMVSWKIKWQQQMEQHAWQSRGFSSHHDCTGCYGICVGMLASSSSD